MFEAVADRRVIRTAAAGRSLAAEHVARPQAEVALTSRLSPSLRLRFGEELVERIDERLAPLANKVARFAQSVDRTSHATTTAAARFLVAASSSRKFNKVVICRPSRSRSGDRRARNTVGGYRRRYGASGARIYLRPEKAFGAGTTAG